jgi:aminoglycoside phosphotransferase (APT) family kinase protein
VDEADDSVTDVRPGDELDWRALETHLRGVLDLPAASMAVRQFTGGRANLTYRLEFGDQLLVLRRRPRGLIAPGAHDMAREHRVLSRLWRVYARAPRSYYFTDDDSIIGAPFVVLEHRGGVVVRDAIPSSLARHDDVARRIDHALIDATADLHTVDVRAAELEDLGRAEGFGQRQVAGWHDRWTRASPDDASPVMHEMAERLAAAIPTPPRASVVHNDLKLDNCQFDADDPDVVVSIFDWDMATLGDPLFDLASLINSMSSSPFWVLSSDEAIDRYRARSGIDVANIQWYLAFATWRAAVVLQQLYNRYARGESADDRLAAFGSYVGPTADRARSLLDDDV